MRVRAVMSAVVIIICLVQLHTRCFPDKAPVADVGSSYFKSSLSSSLKQWSSMRSQFILRDTK